MTERFPRGPAVPFPPPLLFVAGFVAGWLLERRWPLGAGPGTDRAAWEVKGATNAAAGLAVMAWGLLTFARHRTAIIPNRPASRLVTGGPYRFTRNPMYVGFVCLYVGGALLTGLWWPLVLLPAVLALLVALVVRREERYLAEAFGAEYAAYRARVRRWL